MDDTITKFTDTKSMKNTAILLFTILASIITNSSVVQATTPASKTAPVKKTHKHTHAHVHGAAQLNIAFDQNMGLVDFQSPAEAIVGFEHVAKTEKDKKIQIEALEKFEQNISKLVSFESTLSCRFEKQKLHVANEGKHADFTAQFKLTCDKSILGSEILFDFKLFPNIKDLDVIVVADALQKTIEIKNSTGKLILK